MSLANATPFKAILIFAWFAIALSSAVNAPAAGGQLSEQHLGYQFENPGFLNMPGPLAYDAERHRLAIADDGREMIYIFDLADKTFQTLGVEYKLGKPAGLAFDKNGSLYVTRRENPEILIFKFQAEYADTLDLVPLLPSGEIRPGRIFVDKQQIKYIADREKAVIYIIDGDNKLMGIISEKLKKPDGIAIRPSGEILVADKGVDPLIVFNQEREFEKRLSRPEPPTSQININASGLAIDQRGWFYTLDAARGKVIIFDPSGVNKSEWSPAELPFYPLDIVIDRYDNIYMSEQISGRVRVFMRGN